VSAAQLEQELWALTYFNVSTTLALSILCTALFSAFYADRVAAQPATSLADPLQVEQRNAASASSSVADIYRGGIEGSDLLDIESQINAGELPEARSQLEGRITQLQQTGDRYDADLVQPLRLLGRVYHKQGEYPAAAESFALATQISRVNNGLHSHEQLSLVHEEIASLKAMGNVLEANRRHEYAFSIARRHYGRYSEALIPELLSIASWYTSTGDVIGARDRYREAQILLSSQASTATSDTMIAALRGLAKSYREEFFPAYYSRTDRETADLLDSNGLNARQDRYREQMIAQASINSSRQGTEALREIVQIEGQRLANIQAAMSGPSALAGDDTHPATGIAETSNKRRRTPGFSMPQLEGVIADPNVDKANFINALLELGDWHLLMGKEPRAFGYYQHVFNIAVADPNTDVHELLGKPTLLYFPRPRDPKVPDSAPPESFEKGYVEVTYDVDHRGAVRKLRTAASQPKGLMEFHVRSSAKIARFRPSIIDGLPQPSPAQVYRHNFDYFPRGRDANPPRIIDSDVATSDGDTTSGE